jgi:hypothetical protein
VNILVINVSLRPLSDLKLFPVGLGYIVTAIKKGGFDFDLLDIDAHRHSDEEVEVIIRKKKYDVVCIGCIVTGYGIVKALASLIKKYHPRPTGNSFKSDNGLNETFITKIFTKIHPHNLKVFWNTELFPLLSRPVIRTSTLCCVLIEKLRQPELPRHFPIFPPEPLEPLKIWDGGTPSLRSHNTASPLSSSQA